MKRGVVRRPWDNGVTDEVKIALAMIDQRRPLTVAEIASISKINPRMVRHFLKQMLAHETVRRIDGEPARYRLQDLLYKEDLLERLHALLYDFVGEAFDYVRLDNAEDPRGFANNWRLVLEVLALDAVHVARDHVEREGLP